ncbi:MAG: GumC family protein [Vicinamibacteria bacterium]
MATETAPEGASAPEIDIDVTYYAHVLWRGRWLIGTGGLVGAVLGLFVALLQTPEYRASAMLQIEPPTPVFMNVNEALSGMGGYWQNTDFYNTQFKILTSKSVGDRVVERLRLRDREPWKSASDPSGVLMSHVRVEPIPDSRLVSVVVVNENAAEAALWANTIADVYIEVAISTRVEAARRAYDWLQERLATTQQGMQAAQKNLIQNLERQDLFVPEGSVSAVSASITRLNADYVEARARRIQIEAALKQVSEMRAKGQSLDAVPQIGSDSVVAGFNEQLATATLELTKLKERYKEGHPSVQRLLSQFEGVQKAKEKRWGEIAAAMRVEYAQLQRREGELKAAVDVQTAQAASQSRKKTEFETLTKEAESARTLYDVLLQKLNETDIAASIRTNNTTLVDRALPPLQPFKPQKARIAGIALMLGLVLGVGLVLGRDYLDNTIRDPEEIERYLHADLLAAVPRYDDGSAHLVTEAYQNLRTALLFARREDRGQIVLVTGTLPQEGKTTTLVNLGKLMASSGERTIVVDFDLRRATLHTHLGLKREPGVTGLFVAQQPVDTLIRPTRVPNLFVLTAGAMPPNPPALLARRTLNELLEKLGQDFAWVLLDSPPLASVTDALFLARAADHTVMVVRHNSVDKKLVRRALASLRKTGASVLGVVLNAVDVKAKGYYYYYSSYNQQPEAGKPVVGRKAAARA